MWRPSSDTAGQGLEWEWELESGDDGREIAQNYRVFPEADDVFEALYGADHNTSEGGNAHHKATYPHKRAQAVGRIPILLDVHLCFIYDNAKLWYFQAGWKIVYRLVHGGEADLMEPALELAGDNPTCPAGEVPVELLERRSRHHRGGKIAAFGPAKGNRWQFTWANL